MQWPHLHITPIWRASSASAFSGTTSVEFADARCRPRDFCWDNTKWLVGQTRSKASQQTMSMARPGASVELLPEALGSYRWPIATANPEAQAFFDQGMQLRWAYNMPESIASMVRARELDPRALCVFGASVFAGLLSQRRHERRTSRSCPAVAIRRPTLSRTVLQTWSAR